MFRKNVKFIVILLLLAIGFIVFVLRDYFIDFYNNSQTDHPQIHVKSDIAEYKLELKNKVIIHKFMNDVGFSSQETYQLDKNLVLIDITDITITLTDELHERYANFSSDLNREILGGIGTYAINDSHVEIKVYLNKEKQLLSSSEEEINSAITYFSLMGIYSMIKSDETDPQAIFKKKFDKVVEVVSQNQNNLPFRLEKNE